VDGGRIHRSSSARAEFQTITAPEALQPFVARMDSELPGCIFARSPSL